MAKCTFALQGWNGQENTFERIMPARMKIFLKFFSASNEIRSAHIPLANCLQIKKELQTFVHNSLILNVGAPGFEPGTPCSQSRCATGLRYAPKKPSNRADGAGFEPAVQFDPYVGLANRWFQPLTHPSVNRLGRKDSRLDFTPPNENRIFFKKVRKRGNADCAEGRGSSLICPS